MCEYTLYARETNSSLGEYTAGKELVVAENTDIKKNQAIDLGIEDGTECIKLRNAFGEEIGSFTFRPSDTAIVDRYEKIQKDLNRITEPLEKAAGGNGNDEEYFKALRDAKKRLYKALDYLFDAPVSSECFKHMDPFSPVKGRFYCEIVIETLGRFIEERFGAETKAVNDHIRKYTSGINDRK